ncbi:HTH domain-containing protein [Alicyclobacillus sp.]|uniref:HTH domain-containing protein n=1 Tax=Alicyclobacillus sp. TaxID=61169 RepID=UPI0025B868A1|nr:HTH domain-containing protein [Alicyclobacillus sp.]MCL6517293.1 HTH domain-containing protein [Alicyclobacillus sp.]
MQLRLGVLGADDSLAEIVTVASGYPEIRITPVVYWEEAEIPELLRPVADTVDLWLFSGQVPYNIAKAWGGIRVPMLYTPHTGAGLWRVLLHLSHEHGWRVTELSFDTFHPEELRALAEEAGIAVPRHLYHYEAGIDVERLAAFHERLWQEGRTRAAVTCVRSCQLRLMARGVPAHHVTPARDDIARVLDVAVRMHEAARFRDAQIAIQFVEYTPVRANGAHGADEDIGRREGGGREDRAGMAPAGLREGVLRYAARLAGTAHPSGDLWMILTTRGILSAQTADFRTQPDVAARLQPPGWTVTSGIGVGRTVAEAEAHARAALQHARQAGLGAWMCVLDDKSVRGPLEAAPAAGGRGMDGGAARGLVYSYADEELRAVGAGSPLSVATLSKIREALRRLGTEEVTAHELAERLSIHPRSARRLLAALERQGIARVVGEEAPYARGRPRKVYRIQWTGARTGESSAKSQV